MSPQTSGVSSALERSASVRARAAIPSPTVAPALVSGSAANARNRQEGTGTVTSDCRSHWHSLLQLPPASPPLALDPCGRPLRRRRPPPADADGGGAEVAEWKDLKTRGCASHKAWRLGRSWAPLARGPPALLRVPICGGQGVCGCVRVCAHAFLGLTPRRPVSSDRRACSLQPTSSGDRAGPPQRVRKGLPVPAHAPPQVGAHSL